MGREGKRSHLTPTVGFNPIIWPSAGYCFPAGVTEEQFTKHLVYMLDSKQLIYLLTTSGSSHYKVLHDNTDRQVATMVIGLSLTANCWQILSSHGSCFCYDNLLGNLIDTNMFTNDWEKLGYPADDHGINWYRVGIMTCPNLHWLRKYWKLFWPTLNPRKQPTSEK